MDPDVAQLMREERLLEAAQLAGERGDARAASAIYERACDWHRAAVEALRAGDAARALRLGAHAGDEEASEEAIALLARNPPLAKNAAAELSARGQHRWAARLLERSGEHVDAARAWDRAGDALRAAALLERAGEEVGAERVLQAALRRDPEAFDVAVGLGALLARFGNWEATIRVLQRVPPRAPERPEALLYLRHALVQLGLTHAATCASAELAALRPAESAPPQGGLREPPRPTARASPRQARLFGRYDLVREIASSANARVLECVDVVRIERVAVKMFVGAGTSGGGRDALARFEREARAVKALDHPNVVPVRDVIAEPPAIILAWMEGGTLERMLAAPAPIVPGRAVEIACAVLSALGAAHRLGILHRDVKPANVLFDDAGGARLGDFGVAHFGDVSTTATAGIFGTLAYMSPEQREGRPAGVRSDVFSVGVMLREMLTGERPTPEGAVGRPPSHAHRDLDARHDAVVDRMTARDPRQRPVDAIEAREMLAGLSWPSTTRAHGIKPRFEPPSKAVASDDRVETLADGSLVDRWTGRKVERLSLTQRALARARAFALADHEGLQTVWRVDVAEGAIWLESLDAPALDRPLSHRERARLESALEALHAAGAVHGRVDAQHVVVGPAGVVLRFHPEHDPTSTPDRDRLALARL
jgi:serine/threonine-protein kinase